MKKMFPMVIVSLAVILGMVSSGSSDTTLSYTSPLPKEKVMVIVLEILSSYGWPEVKYSIEDGYIRTGSRKCRMNHAAWHGHYGKFSLRYDISAVESTQTTDLKVKAMVTEGSYFGEVSEKRTRETERRMILWLFKVIKKYTLARK